MSSDPTNQLTGRGSRFDFAAFIFAIVFPSLVTLVYFQILSNVNPAIQQTAYAIGKFLQFAFPLAWVWLYYRHRLPWQTLSLERGAESARPTLASNYVVAIGFGVLVVVTMFVLFHLAIRPTTTGEHLIGMVREKIESMGLDQTWKYVALGCFYTVVHSFMEEYYWRWFVYDLGKKFYSIVASNIISSLGFAAHHVILLGFFFGWASPWTYVISAAIAIGGTVWAWMFEQEGKLWSAWISHAIVDAGIFTLGYFIWQGAV